VVFRGRAVPVVWRGTEHKSSTVGHEAYKDLLDAAAKLVPTGVKVVFMADRGFADTELMEQVKQLRWHFRIRIKSSFLFYYKGQWQNVGDILIESGEAIFMNDVYITGQEYGPVNLVLGEWH